MLNRAELSALLKAQLPDAASCLAVVEGTGRVLVSAGAQPPEQIDGDDGRQATLLFVNRTATGPDCRSRVHCSALWVGLKLRQR